MSLRAQRSNLLKVLITCGPTWVPIDNVRVISNISSGLMGQTIARKFKQKGAQVTLIEGVVTEPLKDQDIKVLKFCFFDELARILKKECVKKCDVIVHAAAISDFKLKRVVNGKINSKKALRLDLIPTQKLIESIKKYAPESYLVGFKLQPGLTQKNVSKFVRPLVKSAACDMVVANSIDHGYQGFMCDAQGHILAQASSKKIMAKIIVGAIIPACRQAGITR